MLTVNFKLDSSLEKALKSLKEEYALIRALIISIEDEVMRLHGNPIEATPNMDEDLAKVRHLLTTDKMEAAFIIVKVSEGKFALVSFCAESARPKVRMLYAAGTGHLVEAASLPALTRAQAGRVGEVGAALLAPAREGSRAALMTEAERQREALAAMPLPPAPVALPGVVLPLSKEGGQLLGRLRGGKVAAVTFTVEAEAIKVDKVLETIPEVSEGKDKVVVLMEALQTLLPQGHPRFLALCCPATEEKREGETDGRWRAIMVYICPTGCKPREKMPYASSKASFITQAKEQGVTFVRRLELDSIDELSTALMEAVQEVYEECEGKEKEEEKGSERTPVPPRPAYSKGPRMLI